jgi:excisionase family DNA binding protein
MKTQLVTRRDAAAELGVSVDTLARLVARGEIRTVRIGRAVRIRRDDVVGLIARGGSATRRPN